MEAVFPSDSKGFKKYERLKSKKLLGLLFSKGESIQNFPLKIIYLSTSELDIKQDFPVQILISVPKKIHSKAHQRNKFKRLLREAYRLEKNILSDTLFKKNGRIILGFIYRNKSKMSFTEIRNEVKLGLEQVLEKLNTA